MISPLTARTSIHDWYVFCQNEYDLFSTSPVDEWYFSVKDGPVYDVYDSAKKKEASLTSIADFSNYSFCLSHSLVTDNWSLRKSYLP